MKRTHIVLGIYLLIGLIYTIYASNWGDESYKSFAYHLGQGLVWPAMIFPGIWQMDRRLAHCGHGCLRDGQLIGTGAAAWPLLPGVFSP